MTTPKVSFVVPCYKLAHYLPECVGSILGQTYGDFEVLIMDNCSPDNTPDVAQSFQDPRVRHIRNETNIGHLRNYNKGIQLSRGAYIWQISADDRICRPDTLKRYVEILDAHPDVGYAFSTAIRIDEHGTEHGLIPDSIHGNADAIFNGRAFVEKLVRANTVMAPSVLVRRQCYEDISLWPLDLPWTADWFVWCAFAMHFDVAYLAEPMVCFRIHTSSMTSQLMSNEHKVLASDLVAVPWRIRRMAEQMGDSRIARRCLEAIADEYGYSIRTMRFKTSQSVMTLDDFERSLTQFASSEREKQWLRARARAAFADRQYWQGEAIKAKLEYLRALKLDPWMLMVWAKWVLLSTGKIGDAIRHWRRPAQHQLGTSS